MKKETFHPQQGTKGFFRGSTLIEYRFTPYIPLSKNHSKAPFIKVPVIVFHHHDLAKTFPFITLLFHCNSIILLMIGPFCLFEINLSKRSASVKTWHHFLVLFHINNLKIKASPSISVSSSVKEAPLAINHAFNFFASSKEDKWISSSIIVKLIPCSFK